MVTPVKERMRKMRQKRKGQSLTVWLYPEAANVFKKIKKLTGQTNDEIINLAVREIYNSVYYAQVKKSIERIRTKLSEEIPRIEMATLYRDLIRIFQLDYYSAVGTGFSVPPPTTDSIWFAMRIPIGSKISRRLAVMGSFGSPITSKLIMVLFPVPFKRMRPIFPKSLCRKVYTHWS